MISALVILGKIAEFIGKGLQELSLKWATDKRGRACSSIVRLYYLLVELQSLAEHLHSRAELAIEKNNPSLLAFTFRDANRRISGFTNDLIETFTQLQEALEIFAPELTGALAAVVFSKSNLLWHISQYVIVDTDGVREARKFKYLKSDERLLNIDIGAFVKRLKSGELQTRRVERFEWPDRLLYFGSVSEGFSPAELTFVDINETKEFSEMLKEHINVLAVGTTTLKDYIRNTFTINEVLYERVEIEPGVFG
jgi:hypothetical protein